MSHSSTECFDNGVININTIVVNIFGEPSSGKSTAAMDITARLKRKGINAEYVSEFAKDKVYEQNSEVFKHQEYIFGKQSFKMGRVRDKVQVIVVDSPLILSIIYNQNEYLGEAFEQVVMDTFNSYNNKNYLLVRNHDYELYGRLHNENEANKVREKLILELDKLNIPYELSTSSSESCEKIANEIAEEIKNER